MESKEIKLNIVPKEISKINIFPKGKEDNIKKLHKESISKIFFIKEKRIPFIHQKTRANCGPLSIVNGVSALKGINNKFNLSNDKNFPQTSQGIRKLLSSDEKLRTTSFGIAPSTEIEEDNYILEGGHISNLIKKIVSESNIQITGDRFSGSVPVPDFAVEEKIKNSDWLICNKDFHYVSFVRLDNNDWVFLDSMNNQPITVNQKFIEDNYFQLKKINSFISLKVEDKIKIIKK
jgi:hypothetical protein